MVPAAGSASSQLGYATGSRYNQVATAQDVPVLRTLLPTPPFWVFLLWPPGDTHDALGVKEQFHHCCPEEAAGSGERERRGEERTDRGGGFPGPDIETAPTEDG